MRHVRLEPAPWIYRRADRVEGYACVRASDLRRVGVLAPRHEPDDYWAAIPDCPNWIAIFNSETRLLTLVHREVTKRYEVRVAWEPCRFGGVRGWLLCPTCGTRRGTLFLSGPAGRDTLNRDQRFKRRAGELVGKPESSRILPRHPRLRATSLTGGWDEGLMLLGRWEQDECGDDR